MHILCPHCQNPIELVRLTPREEIGCPACGSSFHLETESTGAGSLLCASGRRDFSFPLLARQCAVDMDAFPAVFWFLAAPAIVGSAALAQFPGACLSIPREPPLSCPKRGPPGQAPGHNPP